MLIPTVIMGILAFILLYIGYSKGEGEHISGLKAALNTTMQILPLLICAFIVAGMIQVLLPRELERRRTVSRFRCHSQDAVLPRSRACVLLIRQACAVRRPGEIPLAPAFRARSD